MTEQNMLIVTSVFKGTTLNKKMRLDHDSLSHPETHILRWFGYISIHALAYYRLINIESLEIIDKQLC